MSIYEVIDIMESAKVKRWIWLIISIVATLISILSYEYAVEYGGSYLIWTGGIIFGFINFLKYQSNYTKCKKIIKKYYEYEELED